MPNQHKTRLLGWNPTSAEDGDWARAEAERRGVKLKALLDEMLSKYRAWCEGAKTSPAAPPPPVAAGSQQPQPAGKVQNAPKGKCDHRGPPGAYCRICGTCRPA